MKVLFTIFFLAFSFFTFAGSDPDFCQGRDTCVLGKIPLIKSGTYHARGEGRTCEEAMEDSAVVFERAYGNMSCGLISGPYVWSCSRVSRNQYVAWRKCNPDSGPRRQAPRGRCVNIGGRLVC